MALANLFRGIREGLPLGIQLGLRGQDVALRREQFGLQQQQEARLQQMAERQEQLADRKLGLDYVQGLGNIFRAKMSPQLRAVVLKSYLGQAQQFTGQPIGADVIQAMTKASDDDQKLIMEGFTEMLQGDPSLGAKQLLAAGEDINTLLPFIMQGQKLKAAREEEEYTRQVLGGGPGAPIPPTPGAGAGMPPTGRPGMAPLPAGRIVPPSAEQLRGPTRYRALIEGLSRQAGVDPRLIEAIVGVESGGDPQAVSSAGARGLMQLLPETGQQYGVAPEQAFNPALNLRGGIAHVKQLLDRYGGDVQTALTAYHSGEGNVDRGTIGPRGRAYAPAVLARYQALGGRPAVAPTGPAAPPPSRPGAPLAAPTAAPVSARPEVSPITGGIVEPSAQRSQVEAINRRLTVLDANIGRLLNVRRNPTINAVLNDLQQERTSLQQQQQHLATRAHQQETLAVQRQAEARQERREVEVQATNPAERFSGELFNRRYAQLTQPQRGQVNQRVRAEEEQRTYQEGKARADVALETLRYTPVQQKQLSSINTNLASTERLEAVSDEDLDRWVGYLRNPAQRAKQLFDVDPAFQAFQTQVNALRASLALSREEGGGGALTPLEYETLEGFIPTGREPGGREQFRAKVTQLKNILLDKIDSIEALGRAKPGEAAGVLEEQRRRARARRLSAPEPPQPTGPQPPAGRELTPLEKAMEAEEEAMRQRRRR
jgi:hypothetical protein